MKRVWDEKLGPSRHLKKEADIPLSHHNWLTGEPDSGDGEVLHKSMFPGSSVKGEYMFLDFINKYFIQLSMACMWLRRALSCHSGFWMGRWYVCGKIEATKGYQQEWARKKTLPFEWKAKSRLFFSWYDCWGCPAGLEWHLTTISGAALRCDRQAYTTQSTAQQISTYSSPITSPDKTDTARQVKKT